MKAQNFRESRRSFVPTLMDSPTELKTLFKACLAELIGTGLFVFASTATVSSGCHTRDVASQSGNGGDTQLTNVAPGSCFLSSTSALLNIAIAFGFSAFVIVFFTASFSGGHINPAISLGMVLTRRISLVRGILYIVFQCSGAAIGSVILKGLDPSGYKAAAGASNQVASSFGVSGGQALGFEIIMTFALVFTVFAATDPARAVSTGPLSVLAPLAIGMIILVSHLILIPIDGCSINPARSFGPAVVSRTFNHYWIFWVGPFGGAIIASLLYELAFRTFEPPSVTDKRVIQSKNQNTDVESGIPLQSHEHSPVYPGAAGLQE